MCVHGKRLLDRDTGVLNGKLDLISGEVYSYFDECDVTLIVAKAKKSVLCVSKTFMLFVSRWLKTSF